MAKLLRITDRIKVKIGDVVFTLAPLTNGQKNEISSCSMIRDGQSVFDYQKAQHLYVKYSLKDVEGVESYDGEEYQLEFEGDFLTDDCVTEIFTLEQRPLMIQAAWQILNGIPDKLVDDNGKKLKGVELEILSKKKQSG